MQQQMADKLAAVLEHFIREVGRWWINGPLHAAAHNINIAAAKQHRLHSTSH
jgi:hypothetical protein